MKGPNLGWDQGPIDRLREAPTLKRTLRWGLTERLVAWDGIEPPTRGFQDALSEATNRHQQDSTCLFSDLAASTQPANSRWTRLGLVGSGKVTGKVKVSGGPGPPGRQEDTKEPSQQVAQAWREAARGTLRRRHSARRFIRRLIQRPRGRSLWSTSSRAVDAKNYLPALVRLACQHLVGGSGLGKRQDIADPLSEFAGLDEGRKLFEAPG
jgi:hypothetical protein